MRINNQTGEVIMGEAIKALLEDNSGDYYFVGQECVLGMERTRICG